MPSTSAKQHRFMEAIAHNPAFAKKAGVPQSVGRDFAAADKGRKFAKGGEMKESKAMEMRHAAEMKKHGVPKKYVKEELAEAASMKRGGKVKKMASGGFTRAADGIAQKGKTKAKQITMCGGGMSKGKR
ncbi:hypothetical protein UFOVP274_17 [uncultured Caudovirales phage]|uniref:Uncharacterized protein n=1 Tax=uncultured Caudovirales phage TaxID=2100421 RepID=A0A6J5LJ84_9CAUD|nr:hypothetical protein UFOVP274_17 [uncultured Caudovirales phage]